MIHMPDIFGASLIVAAALAGSMSVAAAAETALLTRQQALAQVSSTDAGVRRAAVERLAQVGLMSDVPALVRALRDSDEGARELAEAALWQVWGRSGDAEVDRLFQRGVLEMSVGALAPAIVTFSLVIERKPDFAEAWNKRATAYFMAGELTRSLHDCDEVIRRNPDHFGVLAGYGQIYAALGQPERAIDYFQRALRINPNMDGVAAGIERLKRTLSERRGRMI
jgi:tetratricopeptide (TPR) repeat protein